MKKVNCILLIDDNRADNEFHKINIRKAGVSDNVKIANGGEKALDYLDACAKNDHSVESPKPNIIYLDINMPGMDGFEFLQEYAKLDERLKSQVVIIMLTTSLNPDDQKRAMAFNEVTEFQNKPLTVEVIQATVEKYF